MSALLLGRARPDAARRRRLLSGGYRCRRAAPSQPASVRPAQPGAHQPIGQPQFGRDLGDRSAAPHRGHRFQLERIREKNRRFLSLSTISTSKALQPIKGVWERGAGPVVVSAHVSASERNPALRSVIAARVLSRSRVDRARRSSRVTISTSPAASWASRRAELRAVGLGAARHLPDHLLASGAGELAHLRLHALPVCRYPRVAVDHAPVMHRFPQRKGHLISET